MLIVSKNSYGEEKVKRLMKRYPNREALHLSVFGDSKGDAPMMKIADIALKV